MGRAMLIAMVPEVVWRSWRREKNLLPQVGIRAQSFTHPGCSTVILW